MVWLYTDVLTMLSNCLLVLYHSIFFDFLVVGIFFSIVKIYFSFFRGF